MRARQRYVAVTAWRTGGMNVIDFSDPRAPFEIAHWLLPGTQVEAAYWYNGRIYLVEHGTYWAEPPLTLKAAPPGIRVLRLDGLGLGDTRYFRTGYSARSQIADFRSAP